MKPHEERVKVEEIELQQKLSKLNAFISAPTFHETVPDIEDRKLLMQQREAMEEYGAILRARIRRFRS